MLWDAVDGVDSFIQKVDRATKRLGIQLLVQFLGALRMIKYGNCADRLDKHLWMSENVYNETIKTLCNVVVNHYRNNLNRSPTPAEKHRSIDLMKKRVFPGVLVSCYCKH